jgi:hypothetical protein
MTHFCFSLFLLPLLARMLSQRRTKWLEFMLSFIIICYCVRYNTYTELYKVSIVPNTVNQRLSQGNYMLEKAHPHFS